MRSWPASMAARLGEGALLRCEGWVFSLPDLSLLFLALEGGGEIDVRRDVGGVVSLEYTDMAVHRRC